MANRNDAKKPNPCNRWFKFKNGELVEYDKETEKNVVIPKPFTFMVLEDLTAIGGFNEKEEQGILSNEVRDLKKEILNVRTRKGPEGVGYYKDIKEKVKAAGGKFEKSVYIMFKEGKDYVMGNIRIGGSAFSGGTLAEDKNKEVGGWLEFSNKYRKQIYTQAVTLLPETHTCKKGATVYQVPTFKIQEISEAANEAAKKMAADLGVYLDTYIAENLERHKEYLKAASPVPVPESKPVNSRTTQEEKPQMSNHEAIMGTPSKPEPESSSDTEDDLPF